jgi:hypothetical protein
MPVQDGSRDPTVIETYYYPLHDGFWGQKVVKHEGNWKTQKDSEGNAKSWIEFKKTTVNSAIVNSPPAGEASLERVKSNLKPNQNKKDGNNGIQLEGQPCGDVPTAPDLATAYVIANEWNWLNNKIHRVISLEVFNLPGNNHVIDVIEKVTYMGIPWFVNRNNLAIKPNRVSQTLELETYLSETDNTALTAAFDADLAAKLKAGVS